VSETCVTSVATVLASRCPAVNYSAATARCHGYALSEAPSSNGPLRLSGVTSCYVKRNYVENAAILIVVCYEHLHFSVHLLGSRELGMRHCRACAPARGNAALRTAQYTRFSSKCFDLCRADPPSTESYRLCKKIKKLKKAAKVPTKGL
jgi:hypothetical protein